MTLVYGSNPIYLNNIWDDLLTDFLSGITNPIKSYRISEVSFPKYPPTSFGLLKNGTGILTCAVCGFTKDEINVEIEDRSLIITGTPKLDEKNEEDDMKEFELTFECSLLFSAGKAAATAAPQLTWPQPAFQAGYWTLPLPCHAKAAAVWTPPGPRYSMSAHQGPPRVGPPRRCPGQAAPAPPQGRSTWTRSLSWSITRARRPRSRLQGPARSARPPTCCSP